MAPSSDVTDRRRGEDVGNVGQTNGPDVVIEDNRCHQRKQSDVVTEEEGLIIRMDRDVRDRSLLEPIVTVDRAKPELVGGLVGSFPVGMQSTINTTMYIRLLYNIAIIICVV